MLETLRQRKSHFGFAFVMAAFFVGMAFLFAVFGRGGNVLKESALVAPGNDEIVASAADNVIKRKEYQDQEVTYTRAFWNYTAQYDIVGMYRVTQATGGAEIKTEINFASRPNMVVGIYEVTVTPRSGYVFEDGKTEQTFRLTVKPATLQWKFQGNTVTRYMDSTYTEMREDKDFDPTMWSSDALKYNPRDDISASFVPSGSGWTYSWSGVKAGDNPLSEAEAAEANRFYAWDLSKETGKQELANNTKGNPPYIWEAGDYKFTVCDPENYTNPTLILRIVPKKVNIYTLEALQWITREGSNGSALRSGTVYVYQYKDPNLTQASYYYSANQLSSAPNAAWQDWKFDRSFTANLSIYGYREGLNHAIRLNHDQTEGSAVKTYYIAEYDGEYGGTDLGGTEIRQSGRYTAYATLTNARNYVIDERLDDSEDIDARGLSITISNGTVKVKKDWYVVHYNNMLLDVSGKHETEGQEIPYEIPSWTFGSYPTDGIKAPYLQHGDEWNKIDRNTYLADSWASNYYLRVNGVFGSVSYDNDGLVWEDDLVRLRDGAMDLVTFTLKRNGETLCADQMRNMWGYYFNRYMPAGEYEVIFNVVSLSISSRHNHWWNNQLATNCGTEFPGFSQSYRFTVSPCPISVNDAAFNAYNSDLKPFEINFADIKNNRQPFFEVITATFPSAVTRSTVLAGADSYWKTNAETYFDEAPWLTFNLMTMPDNTYYAADAAAWNTYISGANKYRVFYRSNLRNYLDPTEDAVLDKDARYTKYFEVLVYEVVELPSPVHTEFTYTGNQHALASETVDSRYELSDNMATIVGEYTAKFTLRNNADYPIYRWNGWKEDVYPCKFEILPASVTAPSLGSHYYSGLQLYPDIRVALGPTGAPLYQINLLNLPLGQLGYVDAGSYDVELQLRDAANYVWVDGQGVRIADAVNGKIIQKFIIHPALNAWLGAIRLQGWEWGSYSAQVNVPNARATSGAVRYTVTEDEAGLAPVAGLSAFTVQSGSVDEATETAMKALSAKTYYLWAEAVPNNNYATIEKTHCSFTVTQARNWWNVAPSIDRWAEGSTPNAPTATARHGTAIVRVFAREGSEVFYDSTQNINRLAEAKAGKYILQYEVAGTGNYLGIESESREFTVYPAPGEGNVNSIWQLAPGIDSWTEGDAPNLPFGAASEDGVEIVYSYLDANGTRLASAPAQAGNYRLVAVAYRDGVEVARSEVSFEIKAKRNPMSGVDEDGKMNGAMIALIVIVVILGVVGLGLGGVLGYMFMKKKGIVMPWERPKPVMPEISFHYGSSEEKTERETEELPHGPNGQSNHYYDED